MTPARAFARRAYDLALAFAIPTVLACTVGLAIQAEGATPFVRGSTAGYTAAVFLQERDCTTNLALLQLLARPEFSEALSVVVYDIAGRRSASRTTARLHARELPFQALPAPRGAVSRLRRMGYRATPVLVLLGPDDDRVRIASPAPATLAEMQRLASALRALTASTAPVLPPEP